MIGAGALICVAAFAFARHALLRPLHRTPGDAPAALDHTLGSAAGAFFAIVLLNASLIGAAAVTLATSYAFGDVFGTRSSLHRSFAEAKRLLRDLRVLIAGGGGIVLIPRRAAGRDHRPPCRRSRACCCRARRVFLLLLCNDREVLGPWRNPPWLNVLASVIVAVLVLLSLILMATTIFPHIDVTAVRAGRRRRARRRADRCSAPRSLRSPRARRREA